MNQLPTQKRAQVIACLVEGNSMRSTSRMTSVARNTIDSLLTSVGAACQMYQHENLRNLQPRYIQCDEIWTYCQKKERNIPENERGTYGQGDVWTWVAMDADSKLVISWHVGLRTTQNAKEFMLNLADRVKDRVQLTTDAYSAYVYAVEEAFGTDVDYSRLIKVFGGGQPHEGRIERRYSPPGCTAIEFRIQQGNPDMTQASTSFIERQNLTMRMHMRRFTRLTNAFSKKIQNLEYAIALHFMYYNFCRPHMSLNKRRSLGITPAMAAGVTDHQWSLEGIIELSS